MVKKLIDCYGQIQDTNDTSYPVIRDKECRKKEYFEFLSLVEKIAKEETNIKAESKKFLVCTRNNWIDDIVFFTKMNIGASDIRIRNAFGGNYTPKSEKEACELKSIMKIKEPSGFKYTLIQAEKITVERNLFDGNIINITYDINNTKSIKEFIKDYTDNLTDIDENEIIASALSINEIFLKCIEKNKNGYDEECFSYQLHKAIKKAEAIVGINKRDSLANQKNLNVIFSEDHKYIGSVFPVFSEIKEKLNTLDFISSVSYKGTNIKFKNTLLGEEVPVSVMVCGERKKDKEPILLCNGEIFTNVNDFCKSIESKKLNVLFEPSWFEQLKSIMPYHNSQQPKDNIKIVARPKG